jgi:hypothetical protein
MIVASQLALWLATRTGISGAPARFDPVVPGTGVYMPYTLTTKGNDHLFFANDHAYQFSGSQVQEILQQVRDSIFFNLEASKIHLNHSILRPETNEWISFLCEAGDVYPSVAWIWNYHYDICYKWSFSAGHMCSEIHRQDSTRIWDGLVGTWGDQTWRWTLSEATEAFQLMVTGHKNGKAYAWRSDYPSDDGAQINCRWTSKDFYGATLGQQYSAWQVRLKRLGIEYQESGTDCTLSFYLSNDGGTTWNGPYSVSLPESSGAGTGFHTTSLTETISGDRVRWKFEHNSDSELFCITRFIPEFEILGTPITAPS